MFKSERGRHIKLALAFALLLVIGASAQIMQEVINTKAPAAGGGPLTYVGKIYKSTVANNSATQVVTITTSIAAGHTAICYAANGNNNTNLLTGVADSAGNTWHVNTSNTINANISVTLAYAYMTAGLTGGTSTISFTWTNTGNNYKSYGCIDASAVVSASALDTENHVATGTITASPSVPVTTTNAADIVFFVYAQVGGIKVYTIGGGFTVIDTQTDGGTNRMDWGYKIVAATGTYDPVGSYATANTYIGASVALK